MTDQIYISITGQQQGLISKGCSSKALIDDKWQADHPNEIRVLAQTHNMSAKGNPPQITHTPFFITKFTDQSSPLLFQAHATHEILDCEITIYRESPLGTQKKFFTTKLEGAVIGGLSINAADAYLEGDATGREEIAIHYRTATLMHHDGDSSTTSSWSASE